ncbi:MAG: DUF7167 family protein [Plesiomonas shigelloides]
MAKVEYWLDSGANVYSCRRGFVSLEDELGMTVEEWNNLNDNEKDELMREYAWENMDWGYELRED